LSRSAYNRQTSVKRIAQTIAQQVESQHGEYVRDACHGRKANPPGASRSVNNAPKQSPSNASMPKNMYPG